MSLQSEQLTPKEEEQLPLLRMQVFRVRYVSKVQSAMQKAPQDKKAVCF